MIFTPRITAIVAAIVFVAVLVQLTFFSLMPLLGSVANVIPVVIIAIGLLGGAVPGALCGFAAGLLVDSLIGNTLGVTSLALLSAGYLAGRWRESYDIASGWVPPLVTGALTALYGFALAGLQLTLGVGDAISILFLREIVVQALLAVPLAAVFFPLIRRILRPALVDDRLGSRGASRRGILELTG